MAQEKIQLTDYTLKNILGSISYMDDYKRTLIFSTLQILRRRDNGLMSEKTNDTLKYLELARLISRENRTRVIEKIFTE